MEIKKIVVFLALILLLSGIVYGAGEQTGSGPLVTIADKNYKFDAVVEGREVVHAYVVKNPGTAPLHIERVKTG